jgi:hypothetical protein
MIIRSRYSLRCEVLTAVKTSTMVFWVVTPCGLVDRHWSFGKTYCIHLQTWRWRPCVPPNIWYLLTSPHGATTQKTTVTNIFLATRMKSSRAFSHANVELKNNVSETVCASVFCANKRFCSLPLWNLSGHYYVRRSLFCCYLSIYTYVYHVILLFRFSCQYCISSYERTDYSWFVKYINYVA